MKLVASLTVLCLAPAALPLSAAYSAPSLSASALAARATRTPASGNAPLQVSFTGSATAGTAPYTYSWNFGDGSMASTTQNPSHTYSNVGSYTATVTVTDSSAPTETATASVRTTVGAVGGKLTATAKSSKRSGRIPLTVAFTGSAYGGTPPYTYEWNFGDGSATTTTQNPPHTFTKAGTYTVKLTVTDSSSPAKSASAPLTITASPAGGTAPGPPRNLTATAGQGKITLKWAAPSSDGGDAITSYEVFRGTSSGTETYLTSGGCSNLAAVRTCTDTGLTNGTTYYYYVIAANRIGSGPQSNEVSATPTVTTGAE